jgi:hypothetical protein
MAPATAGAVFIWSRPSAAAPPPARAQKGQLEGPPYLTGVWPSVVSPQFFSEFSFSAGLKTHQVIRCAMTVSAAAAVVHPPTHSFSESFSMLPPAPISAPRPISHCSRVAAKAVLRAARASACTHPRMTSAARAAGGSSRQAAWVEPPFTQPP